MSKADRLKEELAYLRVMFAVVVALDASLVAWLVQNFASATPVQVVLGSLLALALTAGIVRINRLIYRLLDALERL